MVYGTRILVIDDEKDICDLISDILQDEGFSCSSAKNSDEAIEKISALAPALIILDIWLQNSNLDGLGILELVRQRYPTIPVIIISGHGTIEIAVNAIKMGAYDYIEKPFTSHKLAVTVKRATEALMLKSENRALKNSIAKKAAFVGSSQAIIDLRATIGRIPDTASEVLITGEFGSGKEMVAKILHKSINRGGKFITVSSRILEQEIFSDTNGGLRLLSMLNNGTLFIREVGSLPLDLQQKVLKLIESQDLRNKASEWARIIGSSSIDLKKEVKDGKFLRDLYRRLSAVQVTIPPLRDRKEDMQELCSHFINYFMKNSNLYKVIVSEHVISKFMEYEWPGNVKQLKNTLEWLMILAKVQGKTEITTNMLPLYILNKNGSKALQIDAEIMSMPLRQARRMFEYRYLQKQMNRLGNNPSKVAKFVGMERSALYRKLTFLQTMNACNDN